MGPLWKATGRPDYNTKIAALRVTLIAIPIIPITARYGIEGTGLLISGVYLFPMLPIETYLIIRSIEGSYRRFFKEIFYPLVASVAMFVAVIRVDLLLPLDPGVVEFTILVAVGAAIYTALISVFAFNFEWSIEENLRSVVDTVV